MAKIQMGRSPSSTTSSRQKDREVHHSPSSSWRKKRDVTTDYIYQTPPKRMLKSSRKHPVRTSGKLGRTRDDNHLPHVDDRSEWSIHRHESGRVFYYNTR